jgi:hypothetical protein
MQHPERPGTRRREEEKTMSPTGNLVFGAPCWTDLSTSDLPRAVEFYSDLFGWTATDTGPEFGHYTNMSKDGALVAAISPKMDPTQASPDMWNIYFAVQDVREATQKVVAAGGQPLFDPMDIGDAGSMTMFLDPVGAAVGLWQPGTHRGFQRYQEPGAPCWFELLTRDLDGSAAFYRDLFGVDISEMDTGPGGPPYRTLDVDGTAYAGIADITGRLPDTVPNYWSTYFVVENIDSAVHLIQARGGMVITPPVDSPRGRWATVADPMNAVFVILGG